MTPYLPLLCAFALFVSAAHAQPALPAPSFSVNPMRMELEVAAGSEKTAVFEVATAPSERMERGRVLISPMDWNLNEEGKVHYAETTTEPNSASPWIQTSPSAITTEPGQNYPVRVTVRVPAATPPGVYRAGLFIQERPRVEAPKPNERVFHVRIRYASHIYVIVPPVFTKAELENVEAESSNGNVQVIARMKNEGTRHVRPLMNWRLLRADRSELASGRRESTVILPRAVLREPFTISGAKPAPGTYEAVIEVDFQDGRPIQSMSRAFTVPMPAPPPEAAPNANATPALQ